MCQRPRHRGRWVQRCGQTPALSWRSFLFAPRNSIKEKARLRLREFDVRDRFSHLPLARASVLLPLMVRAGKLHLLLTVRSMQVGGPGSEMAAGVSPPVCCFPRCGSAAVPTSCSEVCFSNARQRAWGYK